MDSRTRNRCTPLVFPPYGYDSGSIPTSVPRQPADSLPHGGFDPPYDNYGNSTFSYGAAHAQHSGSFVTE